MKYTLITSKGKVYTFFIKAVADTYAQAFGGTVITEEILKTICPEMESIV